MSDVMHAMDRECFPIKKETIAKIRAEVNYDLIKKNEYDKFGDGEYISVETVTEILNETFEYSWSWEIIQFFDKGDYVVCHGRLTIPGIGVRDGIGQAKADKKDNSTAYSSAASFSFKNAAKKVGIAKNIFYKDGMGYEVFEPGSVVLPTSGYMNGNAAPVSGSVKIPDEYVNNNGVQAPGQDVPPAQYVEKPQVQSQKALPTTAQEKAAELKEAYGMQTKAQFVAFAQIWNPNITDFSQLTSEVIETLHTYAENNEVEFEDFKAEHY
jgi:hypothetical protein